MRVELIEGSRQSLSGMECQGRRSEISSAVALGELPAWGVESVLHKELLGLALADQFVGKVTDDLDLSLSILVSWIA